MIYMFFTVLFAEMATILLLLFKTPRRKLLIFGLDHLKRGRAPLVVKSVGATVFVIMMYDIYSISELQSRPVDALTPTDQIIRTCQMLEASLMGFSLFLSLMIDRLHHYIRELRILRKVMDAGKKQTQGPEDGRNNGANEVKALNEEISRLRTKITKLESECGKREKEFKSGGTDSGALGNQAEGLHAEYDRLHAENQRLREQLRSVDDGLHPSSGKKDI